MPRKDVRFNAKYVKNTANDRKDDKVQGKEIGNSTINGNHINDGSLTADKFAPGAVSTASIADGSITTNKIANNSVTADKIATGAVSNDEINTGASPTVNTIYTNNWFRSNGNTGWYNQTHGGGIWMQDSTYVRVYNNKAFMPSAGSGNNGIIFPSNPGGGSGDVASIKYYPLSGERCRFELKVENDSGDEIQLTTPVSYVNVSNYPSIYCGPGHITLRGNATTSGAKNSVIITSPGASFATNWPSGWGGGLATWDIICASIQGNLVNTSDARLKEKVSPIYRGLDLILKLNPVSFYWTKEYNSSLKNQQFGFIAQEVEKIMPELVIPGSYDEVNQKEGNRSLNYIGIIPFLTKSIQEQQTQIESQQKTIESLEARLKALEDLLK